MTAAAKPMRVSGRAERVVIISPVLPSARLMSERPMMNTHTLP